MLDPHLRSIYPGTSAAVTSSDTTPRLLITAGPTHEPIDEVRYLGNRSSGRLGVALADAAADRGWRVTLLLGPTAAEPTHTAVTVCRFQTTADLQALMEDHAPRCDVLVMAAAVADYRPVPGQHPGQAGGGKIKRAAGELTLRLESTPDLIAAEAARKRADQLFVAFALEPRERMLDSARAKLERKGTDAIVANPLETMDAQTIEATLITPGGVVAQTDGPISKTGFAPWLLDQLDTSLRAHQLAHCND